MPSRLKYNLQTIPTSPGVYQFFDENEKIIYIGKAKNLKKRILSYFNRHLESGKTKVLVKQIRDVKYFIVDTEIDALLLENNLIKKYKPKYNILLKDDKTYPWICIKKEAFPRVFSTRRIVKDGSEYFGPYASVKMMRTLLDLIKDLYPLRTCNYNLSKTTLQKKTYKVCLEYHIGNCKAPCVKKQTEEDYNVYIKEIRSIIKGNIKTVIKQLKHKMKQFADELYFEKAEIIKQKIEILSNFYSKSVVVSPTIHNVDVITLVEDEKDEKSVYVNYFKVNNGAIIQGHTVEVKRKLNETPEDILGFVFLDMRERYGAECKEILTDLSLNLPLDNTKFLVPKRGDKKTLVDLSRRNGRFFMLEKHKQQAINNNPKVKINRILETIKNDLRLKELPVHIECFDNSNFQGTNAVAACVVFKNARPSIKDYRHFNIKTVEGPNDFASMEEVVYRRYKRMIDEKQKLPQLIVIDGGKGQLSSAVCALEKLDIKHKVAVIGIAKKLEEIFFPGDSIPLYLDKRSESLRVIQQLRNEAHRFGITHHRNKRSKNAFGTELTKIKGIGEHTAKILLTRFKSVKRIKSASFNELKNCIGEAKAKIIVERLKK